jgi:hypothetical protein
VCIVICLIYEFLLLSSFLSSKRVISGWQEAYLGDSEHLPVGCMSGVTPTLDSRELTQGEIMQVVLTEGLAQQGSAPAESSTIIMRGMPSQVEVVAALKLPSAEGVHTNKAQHRSKDGTVGNASAPGSLGSRTATRWRVALAQTRLGSPP